MTKMSSLNELKNEIEAKENVFKDADKSIAQSNHTLNPESLCKLLDAIDQCLRFFRAHVRHLKKLLFEGTFRQIIACVKTFFKLLPLVPDCASSILKIANQDFSCSFVFFILLKLTVIYGNRVGNTFKVQYICLFNLAWPAMCMCHCFWETVPFLTKIVFLCFRLPTKILVPTKSNAEQQPPKSWFLLRTFSGHPCSAMLTCSSNLQVLLRHLQIRLLTSFMEGSRWQHHDSR